MKTIITLLIVFVSFSLNAQNHKRISKPKEQVHIHTISGNSDNELDKNIESFLALPGIREYYTKREVGFVSVYYTVTPAHKEHIYRYDNDLGYVCLICKKKQN